MEKIIKKEAIGETIMQMAEIADSKKARLSLEIETDNGQMRMKALLWGKGYDLLGRVEFLAGNTALGKDEAIMELEADMASRRNG